MDQNKIIEISDQILTRLLNYKKSHPDFTFSLRQRDSPQAKTVKRLESGQWFQGSDYIYVPLFKKGDSARKIKTIGFVIGKDKKNNLLNYIEISFKSGDFSQEEKDFHKDLAKMFQIKLNKENFGNFIFKNSENYLDNLNFYLDDFRLKALTLLEIYNLKNKYIISENDFQKNLKRINDIKNEQLNSLPSVNINKKTETENLMKISINQILFGPPGTGKTYNTINKALQIINPNFDLGQDRKLVKAEYQKLVDEGRIVFTTFHQSMSYEDFIEGIKPLKPDTDDAFVKYDVLPGIFKTICTNIAKRDVKTDNFDTVYSKLLQEIDQSKEKSLVLETLTYSKEFTIYKNSKNNLRFHANTEKAYEGVIKREYIEHYLKTGEAIDWPSYTKAVGQYLVDKYHYSKTEVENKKEPYILIIDEINRGNVSQIFGELITLIEEDKRLGNNEALEITLPYSKEKFGVPPNLYIIGTMNTADRSVEALDTALRRRFSFEEMPPNYDLEGLQNKIFEIPVSEILKTINQRIEKLLDRDHCIGHAYLLNKDEETLQESFYKNIIPLLQEYFFGDFGKIGLVLGKGFVRKSSNHSEFADFDSDYSDYAEKDIFEMVDYRKPNTNYFINLKGIGEVEMNFQKAILILMKNHIE